jgi:predicted transcriptional regulator
VENFSITTNIDAETYHNFEMLVKSSSCSVSELTAEAIRIYVEDQSWQIDAIKEGIRQAEAGNFAPENAVKSVFSKWGVHVENNTMG